MYKINILSSKDFDDLPKRVTRGSDISDSFGFADPRTKTAYVRHTAWSDLNEYLIDHELEHLVEKHKTDVDEHGICHKKGGFFKNFFDPVGFFHEGNALGVGHNQGKAGLGDAFGGIGQTILPAIGSLAGGPLGGMLGSLGNTLGNSIFGGAQPKQASYQGGMNNMFGGIPQTSQSSMGQGFGQQGSFSPSGMGPQGGQGAPMANMGLGAGLPNNSNISMGQGAQGNQDHRQSGFWFPQYKF